MSKRSDAIGFFWEDLPTVKPPKKEKQKRLAPERTWELPDYLPNLAEAISFAFNLMTPGEALHASIQRETLVFDVECYVNYFLVMFKSVVTGKIALVERYTGHDLEIPKLEWFMKSFRLVSFNGIHYDVPMVSAAIAGKSNEQLKYLSNEIIVNQVQAWIALRSMKVKQLKDIDHIDLIAHAPVGTGLKKCGARLYTPMLQDLPFHPETTLTINQALIVRWYCANDLVHTELLLHKLKEPLELREQLSKEYGVDLRSKSDAQIAEAVIAEEVRKMNGNRPLTPSIPPGTSYKYKTPAFLQYKTALMNWVLQTVQGADFVVGEAGSIGMPPEIKGLEIKIGHGVYRMGIGGLHSSEKSTAHVADADTMLLDRDVTSFYPFIILLLGLYPPHLGPNFLNVYRKLVNRRLEAKRSGNKVVADALKITINGSYGKLASPYSVLYSPDLQIQVTVTGQLVLLMLIERLELIGIPVVSANTDGIVIKCPRSREPELAAIIKQWEIDTGFETEETQYKALYSRDVNNYIAVKPDGKTKTKGVYADPGLPKDPISRICVDAALDALTKGLPILKTVRECKDIRKFLNVRNVPGGAVKNGEYLGKTVRWYYAEGEKGDIVKALNGNSVSLSEGGKPLMKLPEQFPEDINYNWYIEQAEKMLVDIGYSPKPPKAVKAH
jgi:hypothetical protein